MTDELGARMKAYEAMGTSHKLDLSLPICARVDGRSFSRFTRGCDKPFDARISSAMQATCAYLVEQTHALIGYVQSDEISLIWHASDGASIIFDGKVHKMNSVIASMAAVKFYSEYGGKRLPAFDCRVWNLPNQTEAANTILWRALDARKNAVSMACRVYNSAKSMHKKGRADQLEMLARRGIDFDAVYPDHFRHGAFFRRVSGLREIPDAEWERMPEKYRPDSRAVMRSWVERIDAPFFGDMQNREAFIFDAATPQQ